MADRKRTLTREEEIAEIMRTTNLDRGYAEEAVAWSHGEPVWDIEPMRPLTAEERLAIGLDRPAEEVMIELGEAEPDDGLDDDELLAELGIIASHPAEASTRR
jgi:hypothetical protein